jgi:hypothetical protein
MAYTKRNFRKKSKSLKRKGGKKSRNTKSRGRKSARGGAEGDIMMVDRASAPLAAQTSVPPGVSQLIKVSFDATRANPQRVRIDWDGDYNLTMPTDEAVYSRDSTLSKNIMKKHDNFTIIDMDTGSEMKAKFAGFTPTDLYFYKKEE